MQEQSKSQVCRLPGDTRPEKTYVLSPQQTTENNSSTGYSWRPEMNVYDLEKQATPALWCADAMVMATTGTPTSKRMLGSLISDTYDLPRSVADAAYAAHCRNNFMKALEALNEQCDLTGCPKLRALITELEEVKP